eukprot:Opistho-2@49062
MSKKAGGGGKKPNDAVAADVLQAIILADSFNERFMPITLEEPRSLLPLANTPLLDYTIEFLAASGVQEIYVFMCAHAKKIDAHLEKIRQKLCYAPITIESIISQQCLSVGDALREIDQKQLIQSDFILVSGDLVSNMNLQHVLKAHRARQDKDKGTIMTMVLKQADPGHRTRSLEEDTVIAVGESQRLLSYQRGEEEARIPLEVFENASEVQVRYDLLDTHICVCSVQVPFLFTDNFDYQDMRDFVRGILENEEILGNKIHVHLIGNEYAARVNNLRSYDAISKDITHRWTFPMVPDTNFGDAHYNYGRHNIYLDTDVILARSSVLKEDVIIGHGSRIGENTRIAQSIIGKNCIIGAGVTIEGSYLWDGVVVEDGSKIIKSILCHRTRVKHHVTVNCGSILSYDVVVGPNFEVPPHTKLTVSRRTYDDTFDDGHSSGTDSPARRATLDSDPLHVGAEGRGIRWTVDGEQQEEVDQSHDLDFGNDLVESEEEDDPSTVDDVSEPDDDIEEEEELTRFYNNVKDTVMSGITEKIVTDNQSLEINATRHAYNISQQEVLSSVVVAHFDVAIEKGSLAVFASPSQKALLKKYSFDQVNEDQLLNDIRNFLVGRRELLHSRLPTIKNPLMRIMHVLYDLDVISEEGIRKWFASLDVAWIKEDVGHLIEWLDEAEEESDDDD